jgi:hypothetical protein
MRKIDWRHTACLWRHWEVWKYHKLIDKWKGYKLRKRYEEVKKGLGYKVTKLRDSNATYRDNLLWRIVMHYMKIKWPDFPMVIGRRRRREHPQPKFCTTTLVRKKNAEKSRACAEHTSGQGLFRSRDSLPVKGPTRADIAQLSLRMCRTYFRTVHVNDVTSGHAHWSDPPQIWLELSPYTTTMVGGSLRVLRLLPTLRLVAMI